MRILVTGAAGMLGHDVVVAAQGAGHDVIALTRRDLDITEAATVRAALASAVPESVINCAAWTDVDAAETAEEAATTVNGDGAGLVASEARDAGVHLVHVSSDYVFDGRASEPYVESDETSPLSAYGRSKLAGERAIDPDRAAIVRAAWLFGANGPNFVATMLRLASERDEITVVDDQVGCPTYTGHLAQALVSLAERRTKGVLHATAPARCSWFDFAREIFTRAHVKCTVRPGRSVDLGRPALRPAFSVLGTERAADAPRLPSWQDGLSAYLETTRVTR
ncbi:MAG: dTDP-4-dehydrorhamnose reductase [Solirubrobacterales bacterium]|nr:dTDP-4-dehydrorhamnose reductase [Solirubrobacterales bacterium]